MSKEPISLIHSRLDQLWSSRMNRGLDSVDEGVRELRAAEASGQLNAEQALELELLDASLDRARGRFGRAQSRFDAARIALDETQTPLPRARYHLHFQLGLQRLFLSRHSEALEQFLAALRRAQAPREQVWAGTNALISGEYLGLALEKTRDEVSGALANWRAHSPVEALGPWEDQLTAIEARRAFRAGEWPTLFELLGSGQLVYFQAWSARLPFTDPGRFSERTLASGERLLEEQGTDGAIPWQSYRGRTLLGLLQPEDLEGFQPQELADRFYLWVWLWMAEPERLPFSQVSVLLGSLTPALALKLGSEDFQQIRNALLWIGLFAGDPLERTQAVIRRFQSAAVNEYAWYRQEREWLERLHAARDSADLKLAWADPLLVERLKLRCPQFLPRLNAWLERSAAPGGGALLRVDLELGLVEDFSRAQRTLSESLARCLSLLRARPAFRVELLAENCFGIHRYEPGLHQTKIFNLLSRAKKLLPPAASVQVKEGVVLRAEDPALWARIKVLESHELATRVRQSGEWGAWSAALNATQDTERPESRAFPHAQVLKTGKNRLTRLELEALIGKSRATTNRQIAIWEKRGLLRREGAARATTYVICGALTPSEP